MPCPPLVPHRSVVYVSTSIIVDFDGCCRLPWLFPRFCDVSSGGHVRSAWRQTFECVQGIKLLKDVEVYPEPDYTFR